MQHIDDTYEKLLSQLGYALLHLSKVGLAFCDLSTMSEIKTSPKLWRKFVVMVSLYGHN